MSIALFSCTISFETKHAKKDKVKYLNSQGDIYTKGDTLRINGRNISKCTALQNVSTDVQL